MTLDPRSRWIDALARRSGFADAAAFAAEFDLREYRLRQLYHAACKELVNDLELITTLPKDMRAAMTARGVTLSTIEPVTIARSHDGHTSKGLFRLADGKEVEAVLMEHRGGRTTICISSQAGCAFACAFCSTGQAGFARSLTAVEIFDQARFFAAEARFRAKSVTNVVFMGMGEPFHNYEAVMGAVALLNDPQGFGLGQRHVTISTVGLVDKIDAFAQEGIQANLAISLHAPNDALRASIMPVNRRYGIAQLLAACERYVRATHRKVFFEYVMLDGVNDSNECARELASLMRGHLYHVNLIPYNATPDADFAGTPDARIWEFAKILDDAGIPVTVRHNMGRDIAAACGQLRAASGRAAGDRREAVKSKARC